MSGKKGKIIRIVTWIVVLAMVGSVVGAAVVSVF